MVGLLFAFMPVLANNRSGGDVDHFDVMRLLVRHAFAARPAGPLSCFMIQPSPSVQKSLLLGWNLQCVPSNLQNESTAQPREVLLGHSHSYFGTDGLDYRALSCNFRRVTMSLGTGVLIAVLVARTLLPPAVRLLAKHASLELYQLTLISFCLCCGWLSGFMVPLFKASSMSLCPLSVHTTIVK
jgi:hypothetical protein